MTRCFDDEIDGFDVKFLEFGIDCAVKGLDCILIELLKTPYRFLNSA
jgi:hypothetical protein